MKDLLSRNLLVGLLVGLLSFSVAGVGYADDIILGIEDSTAGVQVIDRVENIYISTPTLVVHTEQATLIDGEEVKVARTGTTKIDADDVINISAEVDAWISENTPFVTGLNVGEDYNTYALVKDKAEIDTEKIKGALVYYKGLVSVVEMAESALAEKAIAEAIALTEALEDEEA